MKIINGFLLGVIGFLPMAGLAVAPTASNQTNSVAIGGEVFINLSLTDPDTSGTSSQMTVTVVSPPLHGTLQCYGQRYGYTGYNNYWYFRADTNFTGIDAFSWMASDGVGTSGVATVTVNILTNTIPLTRSSTNAFSVNSASNYVWLSVTHPSSDSGQSMSCVLVSGPTNGTLFTNTFNYSMWFYTPASNYLGGDSYVWYSSDGFGVSVPVTNQILVTGVKPVPQNQDVCLVKNTPIDFLPLFTGGTGYSLQLVTPYVPVGTISVVGGKYHYVPPADWTGKFTFGWQMLYSNATTLVTNTPAVTCTVTVRSSASADWPMWRQDESRNGIIATTMPDVLYLQWRRDFSAPKPGWKAASTQGYAEFDLGYEPVVQGKTLYMGLNATDCLVALDTDTGVEKWRFYAEAPIRFAPVATSNRVFVVADDGKLYGLSATNGSLLWVYNGTPTNRKIFGHRRLVSNWPVRGGVVYCDGKLYFSVGVYSLEGVMAYCVDAATGAEVWRNDRMPGLEWIPPHDSHFVASGPAPQGYLTVSSDKSSLYLPTGNSSPALLPLATGFQPNDVRSSATRGWWVDGTGTGGGNLGLPPIVVAGGTTYNAASATAMGVVGTVHSMVVGDGKWIVSTRQGGLYCFGGSNVPATVYALTNAALSVTNDEWTGMVSNLLASTTNNEGCALVLGIGSGRVVEELLLQATNLHVVTVDPDPAKVAQLRLKLDAAGLYGQRCSALVGDPTQCGLPANVGRVIASGDLGALGFPALDQPAIGKIFAGRLYELLRPYGGALWLPTSGSEHAALAGWIMAAGVANPEVSRHDVYSQVRRMGPLPGAVNLKAYWQGGSIIQSTSPDKALKAPLGVQWFDSNSTYNNDIVDGKIATRNLDVYTGLPVSYDTSVATYPATNDVRSSTHINSVYGIVDRISAQRRYTGCHGGDDDYGLIRNIRSGSAAFYDSLFDSGLVHFTAGRPACNGLNMNPGNGVLVGRSGYCGSCPYPLQSSFALMNRPEEENWADFSAERSRRLIETQPVRRLGVNFGAPGDRMDNTGTLWLHRPKRASSTPMFEILINGMDSRRVDDGGGVVGSLVAGTTNYYHHATRIQGGAEKSWVAASGILGATNITVGLTPEAVVATALSVQPVVDGVLTDACWNSGSRSVYMSDYSDNTYAYDRAFRLYADTMLRYDASTLYVACRATGTVVSATSWRVVLSDQVNALTNKYMLFQVNGDGTGAFPANTTTGFTTNNGLQVEWAIPLATLSAAGYDTNKLVFNVSHSQGAGMSCSDFRTVEFFQPGWNDLWQRFAPLSFDVPYGPMNQTRTYTVRLHFAETEGALMGQRLFNVKIQGQLVLTNFDVVAEAGGPNLAVVKSFSGISAKAALTVELVPVAGATMISGLELIEGGTGGNNPPEAKDMQLAVSKNKEQMVTLTATDADSDPLTYRIISEPAHGVLWTMEPRPTISYFPQAGYTGPDSVTYVANDGKSDSPVATVMFNVADPDPTLAAYWRLDETGNGCLIASDSSGNGNHGAINNGVSWCSGVNGGGYDFDGMNGYVQASRDLNCTSNGLTMALWFRWDGRAGDNYLFDKGYYTYSGLVNGGYLTFAAYPGGAYWKGGTTFPVSPGQWYHMAMVLSPTNRLLYRNGTLVYSESGSNTLASSRPFFLGVGAPNGGPVASTYFDGKMDEVRISTRPLLPAEIAALAVPGMTPPSISVTAWANPGVVTGRTAVLSAMGSSGGGESNLVYTWSTTGTPPAAVSFNVNGNNEAKVTTATFAKAGNYAFQVLISDEWGQQVTSRVSVVVGQTLVGASLTPKLVTVMTNRTQGFSASLLDQFGNGMASQPQFLWSVSGGGTMGSTSGVFTAASTMGGPHRVVATGSGYSATGLVSIAGLSLSKKMKITFSGYNRSEVLQNFPVLVKFSSTMTNGFSYGQMYSPSGYDLRFKAEDETTLLSYEIESWKTNGESCVWVQVPALTNSSSIWAYWGDAGITNQLPCTTNGVVWMNGYVSVWHLPDGGNLTAADSTTNRNQGSVAEATATNGVVGGAADFNGTSAYVQGTNKTLNLSRVTITAMINLRANVGANGQVVGFVNGVGSSSYDKVLFIDNANKPRFFTRDWGVRYTPQGPSSLTSNTWHVLHATADGACTRVYLDGVEEASVNGALDTFTGFTVPNLFINGVSPITTYMKASIDEVRITGFARSTNWIWAESLNMGSNQIFNSYAPVDDLLFNPDADYDGMPDLWEAVYGLSSTNAADSTADPDGDGMSNYEEFIAGTGPTNGSSRFEVRGSRAGGVGFRLTLNTVSGRIYGVLYKTNLMEAIWHDFTNGLLWSDGELSIDDPATNDARFYRINVDLP